MVGWTFQDHKKGDLTIEKWGFHHLPGLVMTKSSPWKPWPIEIDGLPIKNGWIFHGKLLNNQMVSNKYARFDQPNGKFTNQNGGLTLWKSNMSMGTPRHSMGANQKTHVQTNPHHLSHLKMPRPHHIL
jgi:hypothetical protein